MQRSLLKTIIPSIIICIGLQGCVQSAIVGGALGSVININDRRTSGAHIEDEAIESKAKSALRQIFTGNDAVHINVTSYNRVALVTGEVPDVATQQKVAGIVANLQSVRSVQNESKIAPPTPTESRAQDAWLTTKAKAAIAGTNKVDSGHIKVVTEAGVVYLMGIVSHFEAKAATEAAASVKGVEKVVTAFEFLDQGGGGTMQYFVLTIIGQDKTGLVEQLSSTVSAHQANWLDASMSQLAGQFAGILQISVPPAHAQALLQAFKQMPDLLITVRDADPSPVVNLRQLHLSLVAHDRIGIVKEVSHILTKHGVNVQKLSTFCTSAPMSGDILFNALADLQAPADLSTAALKQDLESLSDDLMVDMTLGEVL